VGILFLTKTSFASGLSINYRFAQLFWSCSIVTFSTPPSSPMAWSRLIRFLDDEHNITYGEPCIGSVAEFEENLENGNLFAAELVGSEVFALSSTGRQVHVQRILGILTADDASIIRCIGLNYMKHSEFHNFQKLSPRLLIRWSQLLKVVVHHLLIRLWS
jgi:hypothetical protein